MRGRAVQRVSVRRPRGAGRAGAPALRERSGAVLAVAAEEFVGALAGEGDGDVFGGELAEGEEAEGREVGEGFVEVPDEFGEVESCVVEGELELVVVGAVEVGDAAGVGELVARRPSSRKPTQKVLTGSLMLRAISATIRLESRPPESIAPSGTSLISRSRTDSSSSSSSRSACSCGVEAGRASGFG